MASILSIFFLLGLVFDIAHAFRVLTLATNIGFSHLEFTGGLSDLLVDAGHEVDYVLSALHPNLKHNGTKKANLIRRQPKNADEIKKSFAKMSIWKDAFTAEWDHTQMKRFGEVFGLHCEGILTDSDLLTFLRSRNYTVGLAENFDGCAWAVFRLLGIKSVHELNAIPLSEKSHLVHGFQHDIRHIPVFQNHRQVGSISTTFDFFYNFYQYLITRFVIRRDQVEPTEKAIRKLLGSDHPNVAEMQRNSSFIWSNTHIFSDFARATSPKVKYIGGIAVKRPETLNKETAKIFDLAKIGVILVSFGSIVDTTYIRRELRDEMLQTFARFPEYRFIWRLTKVDENITAIINRYPNVHAFEWVQQASILAHPKTRGFISHVGLNSYNEAAHYGVPIVAIPFFADQFLNAAIAVKRGIAVHISRKEINMELLTDALNQILYIPRYRQRSLEIKAKIANLPQNSAETFVKYIEFAEKFGSLDELRLDTDGESIFEQFYLDLIGGALFLLVIFYLVITILLKQAIRMILLGETQVIRSKKID